MAKTFSPESSFSLFTFSLLLPSLSSPIWSHGMAHYFYGKRERERERERERAYALFCALMVTYT
jgi:hypothetical protein